MSPEPSQRSKGQTGVTLRSGARCGWFPRCETAPWRRWPSRCETAPWRRWPSRCETAPWRRWPSRREPLPGIVGELGVLLLEGQDDLADGAVAVLGDDDVGLALPLGVLVVVLVAVDEHDQVGVLLNLAGLTQVRQDRLLVVLASLLDGAAELREGDDRDVELPGQPLEATADLADLLHPALDVPLGSHQLQIVDYDQPQAAGDLAVQPTALGPHLQHAGVRGIVD